MSTPGLRRRLLRIGRQAGKQAEAGRIRFVALLTATVMTALALSSLIATHATYEGQAARGLDRTPVLHEDAGERPARALWAVANDSISGSGPFAVQFILPLTEDAPLPPGVRRWPGPGEAILSPALRARAGTEDIGRRYGRDAGAISPDALQSPDELLAYVRPATAPAPRAMQPIVGYGPQAGPAYRFIGQSEYAKPEWTFQIMPLLLLLLPATVLLMVAARSGAHHRDRRAALVEVLGGTPGHRALIVTGEALTAVTTGAALALAAVATGCVTDVPLPLTGHVVAAADLARWWWALALTVIAAAVVVLIAVTATDRLSGGRHREGNRPRAAGRSPVRWALSCPVMLLIAVRGPELFEPGTTAYVMTNWIGVAATLATLPAAVAVVTSALGRGVGGLGRRWGRPGLLVAGHRAAAHPAPIARMTAGVVVAVGLLLQVVAWQGQLGDAARAARATVDRVGNSALVIRPRGATAEQLTAYAAGLPPDVHMVSLTTSPQDDRLTVHGRCPALRVLGLGCPSPSGTPADAPADPRMRELLGWYGERTGGFTVHQADPWGQDVAQGGMTQTVLVSGSGSDLSVPDAKKSAYRAFPLGADVDSIGGEWLTAAEVNRVQGRWITLFGLLGICVLASAAAFGSLAEFLRNGRALAPLTGLAGNRRIHWATAAVSVLAPLCLAGIAGCVIGAWLAFPKTASGASYITDGLLVGCAAVVALVGVVAWIWGATVSVRQATLWRPRGE
ncbi:ABC transporter permease [Streptomyces sp. NPDC048606]|uniref:ABC transporter permease n=1 Tax=Streptomyces sp. NPDC048606 TaxID=3154726 RepID=UPI00342DE4C5